MDTQIVDLLLDLHLPGQNWNATMMRLDLFIVMELMELCICLKLYYDDGLILICCVCCLDVEVIFR